MAAAPSNFITPVEVYTLVHTPATPENEKVAKKGRPSATLAERIRALLTDREKTVTWLANTIGVTRAAASRIVNGQTADPAASIVKRIADALDVSADELLRS